MAQSKGPIRFKGSLGDIRSYYDSDLKKWIYSTKGGANKELIKNSPAFARTRELNEEWKGNSIWAKIIRKGTDGLSQLKQGRNNCYLLMIAEKIQVMNHEDERGNRRIESSKFNYPLIGFSFSKKHPFNNVFFGEPELSITDDRSEVTLALNNFISKNKFSWPEHIGNYRIYLNISVVPDVIWNENRGIYETVYTPFNPMGTTKVSEWMSINTEPVDISVIAKFPFDFKPKEKSIVIATMGIEFASAIEYGCPYVVKDRGTTAILGCF
ncbi:MAG: hypothetical protein HXX14_12230 [Bacteroidetes bacterium]|nr:hypothetical protein [Bacteroidota bacterium]